MADQLDTIIATGIAGALDPIIANLQWGIKFTGWLSCCFAGCCCCHPGDAVMNDDEFDRIGMARIGLIVAATAAGSALTLWILEQLTCPTSNHGGRQRFSVA